MCECEETYISIVYKYNTRPPRHLRLDALHPRTVLGQDQRQSRVSDVFRWTSVCYVSTQHVASSSSFLFGKSQLGVSSSTFDHDCHLYFVVFNAASSGSVVPPLVGIKRWTVKDLQHSLFGPGGCRLAPPLPLRSQDGDHRGREVSCVPRSTFWPS